VVRGMLESAGIHAPGSFSFDPLRMREPPAGFQGLEISVPESQADEARKLLAEYRRSTPSQEDAEPPDPETE
jgi:hypothetical protein